MLEMGIYMDLYLLLISIFLGGYAYLAWRDFSFGLVLIITLLPVYLLRFEVVGVPTTLLEMMIGVAFVVWVMKGGHRRVLDFWRAYRQALSPLLLILAAACISVSMAPDVFGALGIWKAYFVEPAIVFLMIGTAYKGKREWFFWGLCGATIFVSLVGAFQYVTGMGIPVPWDFARRVTGVFAYPNALGLFVGPVVASAGVLIARAKDRVRWLYLVTILMGTLGICLAETEAAFVAVPAGVVFAVLMSEWDRKKKALLGVGCTVLIALAVLIGPVLEKIFLQDYSGQVRVSQWEETILMLEDHFVFGAGLNGYPVVMEGYHDAAQYEIFQYPHHLVLNVWSELGLLGLIGLVWLGAMVLRAGWRGRDDVIALAAIAALATMTVHGLVDVPYFKNDLSVIVWVMVGVVLFFDVDGRDDHGKTVT